jgi:predicted outer membrane repeat protein
VPGEGEVALSWEAGSDAHGPVEYRVYRADVSGDQDFETPLDSTLELEYTDTAVVNGLTYYYVVRAVDQLGNEDANTVEAGAMPQAPSVQYEFMMDTDPGWSTEGLWAFGQPTGDGGQYGGPDPTSGYTGTNVYGYNLNGDYENNLSSSLYLTTTAIDCRGFSSTSLRFRRWLGLERSLYDRAYIEASNDGTLWEVVWENPDTAIEESSWSLQEYDLSSVADGEETVYIRWGLGPTDLSWQYCGWNIDDVEILAIMDDSDGDGLPDNWERQYFDGLDHGPNEDVEPDGMTNLEEYRARTDPTNPNSDGDGLEDGYEYTGGTNPAAYTHYVSTSGGDDGYDGILPTWNGTHGPKATIQAGMDDAVDGEEVIMIAGVYTGSGNKDLDFQGKAILVEGLEGPSATVIDCEGSGRGFIFQSGEDAGSVVSGLTITNGDPDGDGGAIYCEGSGPTIRECVMTNNVSDTNGGAICCRVLSSATVHNCLFAGNYSGNNGGAVFTGYSEITIVNSTFADNISAVYGGGAAVAWSGEGTIVDSIFWGNTAAAGDQMAALGGSGTPSTISVSYCDVQGGLTGTYESGGSTVKWLTGSMDADPLFVTGDLGDYYLSQSPAGQTFDSPVVDAGSDTAVNLGLNEMTTMTTSECDSGGVDMGYHYRMPREVRILSISRSGGDIVLRWNASPGKAYTVQHSLDFETWEQVPVGDTNCWVDVGVLENCRLYRVVEQ